MAAQTLSMPALSVNQLLRATRPGDWMQSFVPFVMGCVYLWLWWFNFRFTEETLRVIFLSLLTTVGFAALGYFINEYFDKESDARSGKVNKLAWLPAWAHGLIFSGILLCTFLPWKWLPADRLSYTLIFLQVILFLLYSMPFPRLKETVYAALVVDSLYAYTVPLLLSFHTFSLLAGKEQYPVWFWLLLAAVSFIGLRNIITHQIRDVYKDAVAGYTTLPMVAGVEGTIAWQQVVFAYEVFLMALTLLVLGAGYAMWLLVLLLYGWYAWRVFTRNGKTATPAHMFQEMNKAYNLVMPLVVLFFLGIRWPYAWMVLVIHAGMLVPVHVWHGTCSVVVPLLVKLRVAIHQFMVTDMRHALSMCINYPVYGLFLIMGVDLKKEGISAFDYLRKKFGKR